MPPWNLTRSGVSGCTDERPRRTALREGRQLLLFLRRIEPYPAPVAALSPPLVRSPRAGIVRGETTFHFSKYLSYIKDFRARAIHEYPRIPGQRRAARFRRAGASRHPGLLGRRGGGGGGEARRSGLGGEGANPRGRPRQRRRRESRQIDRRCP